MTQESRIESLKARHAALKAQVAAEDARPRPDEELINRLKIEKLHLKEEIERLQAGVAHA
jgi:hypothetical protein